MVPRAGRHVHVRVAVVDHVQTPQRLHVVQAPMHAVLGDEVEDHDGDEELHPGGRRKQMKQAHFVRGRPGKHAHGGRAETPN